MRWGSAKKTSWGGGTACGLSTLAIGATSLGPYWRNASAMPTVPPDGVGRRCLSEESSVSYGAAWARDRACEVFLPIGVFWTGRCGGGETRASSALETVTQPCFAVEKKDATTASLGSPESPVAVVYCGLTQSRRKRPIKTAIPDFLLLSKESASTAPLAKKPRNPLHRDPRDTSFRAPPPQQQSAHRRLSDPPHPQHHPIPPQHVPTMPSSDVYIGGKKSKTKDGPRSRTDVVYLWFCVGRLNKRARFSLDWQLTSFLALWLQSRTVADEHQ